MNKINKTMKMVLALAVVMMLTGGASALVIHSVSGLKMHLTETTMEESLITIDTIVPVENGSDLVTKILIGMNSADPNDKNINIKAKVYDIEGTLISSGTVSGLAMPAGSVFDTEVLLDTYVEITDIDSISIAVIEL